MGIDRERQDVLDGWDARKDALRGLVVDTQRLTHGSFTDGDFVELDPVIWFPAGEWAGLAYHDRQWIRVEAAAMTSASAVLVGRSAARKLGMWVIAAGEERVEVALPSRGSSKERRESGRYKFHHSSLRADEQLVYEGHRVTNPIRTFIDIARHHGFVEGLIAADYLLRRGKNRSDIEHAIRRMGRAKGIAVARRCLAHAIDNSDSPYESLARALLIEAGIGPVAAQAKIERYYADLLVKGWLIIEIDGEIKYEGNDVDEVLRAERHRQKRIGNKGYVFLRFSPSFLRKHPEKFIAEVRAALAGNGLIGERIAQ